MSALMWSAVISIMLNIVILSLQLDSIPLVCYIVMADMASYLVIKQYYLRFPLITHMIVYISSIFVAGLLVLAING